jgi:hypothetical protein
VLPLLPAAAREALSDPAPAVGDADDDAGLVRVAWALAQRRE